MRCDQYRVAASARLDGEPLGLSPTALEHHLATCLDCARWEQQAVRLTRQVRVGEAAVPDLTGPITARIVLPAGRVLRRRLWLRVALALVGLVQLAIAVPALSGDSVGMAMSLHAAHESAAWNLAIGVALLACAVLPNRARGLIVLLGTFVVVLAALCVRDLAAGAVPFDRVATHFAAGAGLVLLIVLDRSERALPPGRSGAGPHRAADAAADDPDIRGVA